MKAWVLAFLMTCVAQIGQAQDWGNLDALLFANLTTSGTAEASFWLPNSPNPVQATTALGVVYEHIPGSAGNVVIATGIFIKQANAWVFAGDVDGFYGNDPRDVAFSQGYVDVTTTLLGPNEPRCCPTLPSRWRVDLGSCTAVQIN